MCCSNRAKATTSLAHPDYLDVIGELAAPSRATVVCALFRSPPRASLSTSNPYKSSTNLSLCRSKQSMRNRNSCPSRELPLTSVREPLSEPHPVTDLPAQLSLFSLAAHLVIDHAGSGDFRPTGALNTSHRHL